MRAASATMQTNIGVLPLSDTQRSHCLSLGLVWAESTLGNIRRGSSCLRPIGGLRLMNPRWPRGSSDT
jgi:hypothetical protein